MTDLSKEALDALCEMLLQTDKNKIGYYGPKAYNRDGRQAVATITAMHARENAIVSAAFEAAAKALDHVANNWDCGHMESRLCDCARDAEQWAFAADECRALTPPADLAAKIGGE